MEVNLWPFIRTMATLDLRPLIKSINTENVVASAGIGKEVDLELLARKWDEADYDPDQFPRLIYSTEDPRSAILLFQSGKFVCTGAKSIDEIYECMWVFLKKLQKMGTEVNQDPQITIQNLIASADLRQHFKLNIVAIGFGLDNIEYDPDGFPGWFINLTNLRSSL